MERPRPPQQPFTAAQWNAYIRALSAWEAWQRRQAAPATTKLSHFATTTKTGR
jgi:hypothetical protein